MPSSKRKIESEEEEEEEEVYHVEVITKARVAPPSSGEEDEDDQEQLRRKKGKSKKPKKAQWEYFVKWANYNSDSNSWEPAENVAGCQRLLASFWEEVGTDNGDYDVGYNVEASEKWIKKEKRHFQKEYNEAKRREERNGRNKTSLAVSDDDSDDDKPLMSKKRKLGSGNEISDDDIPLSKLPPRKILKSNSAGVVVTDPDPSVNTVVPIEDRTTSLFSSPDPEPVQAAPAPAPPPPPPRTLPPIKLPLPKLSHPRSQDKVGEFAPEHVALGSGLSTKQRLSLGALAPRPPKAIPPPPPKSRIQPSHLRTASSSLMPLSFKKSTVSAPMIPTGGVNDAKSSISPPGLGPTLNTINSTPSSNQDYSDNAWLQ
ncbi:hypothetical protein C0991_000016 [Blastosporella zonata]|nr:hypothetical protein C0991_000016 [Blastosporella zonata]